VEVRWRPAAEPGEESPLGYEVVFHPIPFSFTLDLDANPLGQIYFVPAEKRIEEDELLSLPKWTRVEVPDPGKNSHMIWNQLEPDTEYVFKIRAL
jgi:hypothetical protein